MIMMVEMVKIIMIMDINDLDYHDHQSNGLQRGMSGNRKKNVTQSMESHFVIVDLIKNLWLQQISSSKYI